MEYEYREEEVPMIAEKVLSAAKKAPEGMAAVVALQGDLGAGKTTLTKAIGKMLGIEEELASPTFIIMRRHDAAHPRFKTLYHIDAYRLENGAEMEKLGFREMLSDKDALVIVEWPEKIESAMPEGAIRAHITHVSEGFRKIQIDS